MRASHSIKLWAILLALFTTFPVIFITKYIDTNEFYWIILSFLAMCVINLSLYKILLHETNHTGVFILVKTISMILMAIFGIIFLHDELKMNTVIAGILSIVSIILLSYELFV